MQPFNSDFNFATKDIKDEEKRINESHELKQITVSKAIHHKEYTERKIHDSQKGLFFLMAYTALYPINKDTESKVTCHGIHAQETADNWEIVDIPMAKIKPIDSDQSPLDEPDKTLPKAEPNLLEQIEGAVGYDPAQSTQFSSSADIENAVFENLLASLEVGFCLKEDFNVEEEEEKTNYILELLLGNIDVQSLITSLSEYSQKREGECRRAKESLDLLQNLTAKKEQ